VAPTSLRERGAYRDAWPLGKAVIESELRGKAAQELSQLKNWVFEQLQMCTPAIVQLSPQGGIIATVLFAVRR
jgi:hypothetical protein